MNPDDNSSELDEMKKRWKKKFWPEIAIFDQIHPGDRIFVGTGCGEPQYLVGALKRYVETRPNSLFGAEMIHVWTLGIAPCAEEKFRENFRLNSFFVGSRSRGAINRGDADYTPIFLSEVPALWLPSKKYLEPIHNLPSTPIPSTSLAPPYTSSAISAQPRAASQP